MNAKCPECDCKEFLTCATVLEDWKVDEEGNWIDTRECVMTIEYPNADNIWTCAKCGAEAEVTE